MECGKHTYVKHFEVGSLSPYPNHHLTLEQEVLSFHEVDTEMDHSNRKCSEWPAFKPDRF